MARTLVLTLGILGAGCGDGAGFTDAGPPPDGARDDAQSAVDAAVVDAELPDGAPVVLTSTVGFASALGSLCGVAYDHVDELVWLHPCSGADVHAFTSAGAAMGTLARPGESANDVDVAIAPAAITIGTAAVAEGAMLFVNGEAGTADVYLPDTADAAPLVTAFGDAHVVGGGYHAARGTLFLVQDRVAATSANTIAEIDAVTGAVIDSFSTLPAFDVNYGDVEVCQATGHLFVVSSFETTIAELTPTGALVAEYTLPANVVSVSGIGLGANGDAWLCGTGGEVWRVDGLPCGVP
jgi:hypothetical protein